MKQVLVFDSFPRIYDEDNNLIHDCNCYENVVATNVSLQDALAQASNVFEETKLLGDYTEIVSEPQYGRYETRVEFADKKILHRVIYLKDV